MNKSTNDILRTKAVNKICKLINNKYNSIIIEKSVYNYCIEYSLKRNISRNWKDKQFIRLYINKLISIYSNLSPETYVENNYLIDLINDEKIKLEKIAYMPRYDIFPDRWKYLIEEKIKKDKILNDMKPNEMTDQIRCNRCGGRKCSYYAMQTRSADEPMTLFITCLSCHSKWKQ